jgi:hypothetical protein
MALKRFGAKRHKEIENKRIGPSMPSRKQQGTLK